MKKNISIKNIFILLSVILIAVMLILSIVWLFGGLTFSSRDKKENREMAESFYQEFNQKYSDAFEMNYTYDKKRNLGFFSGGGFTEDDCFEKYIRDAWTNEEIISISLCKDEKITKEKLETLNNFWKKYEEIFKIE